MITETAIRCFLSLAETLNFTQTAKQLFTSQQAVSHQIARLEEELSVRLFLRNSRSVTLTECGKHAYHFFYEESRRYQEFLRLINAEQPKEKNTLNVGYLRWLEVLRADIQVTKAFHQKYGSKTQIVSYRYNYEELNHRFEQGELDIVITLEHWLPDRRDNLNLLPLWQRPVYLVAATSHPLARPGASCNDFQWETFYIDQFENEDIATTVHRGKYDWFPDPERTLKIVPNRETVLTEVKMGKGVFLSGGTINDPNLTCYPVGKTIPVVLYYRRDTKDPAISRFSKMLQSAYAAEKV